MIEIKTRMFAENEIVIFLHKVFDKSSGKKEKSTKKFLSRDHTPERFSLV